MTDGWLAEWNTKLLYSLKSIPGTIEIVKELKEQNFIVALLSNATQKQAEHIQKLGYYKLFDPALISCEIECEKPNSEAFHILLQRLNLNAEECLFIDDKKENVDAALAIGIESIQFTNADQLRKELEDRDLL